jgi:hypothetical protein
MVFGRSCSESGRLELGEEGDVGGGGCLGIRLYLVLLGLASASSSSRKDRSSLSAISSRVRGVDWEDVGGEEADDGSGMGFGVEETLFSVGAVDDEVEDQSQPILNVVDTRLKTLCY